MRLCGLYARGSLEVDQLLVSCSLVVFQRQGDPAGTARIRTMHCTAAVAEMRHCLPLGHSGNTSPFRPSIAVRMQDNTLLDASQTPLFAEMPSADAFPDFHKIRKQVPLGWQSLQNAFETATDGQTSPALTTRFELRPFVVQPSIWPINIVSRETRNIRLRTAGFPKQLKEVAGSPVAW